MKTIISAITSNVSLAVFPGVPLVLLTFLVGYFFIQTKSTRSSFLRGASLCIVSFYQLMVFGAFLLQLGDPYEMWDLSMLATGAGLLFCGSAFVVSVARHYWMYSSYRHSPKVVFGMLVPTFLILCCWAFVLFELAPFT